MEQNGSWTPPYVSWTTFLAAIERMATDGGVPSRIDNTYLSNLAGSTRAELRTSMKALGLIDDQAIPRPMLIDLVQDAAGRPVGIGEMLARCYPRVVALDARATQGQLEEEFRALGVRGSTLRKAVRFFLSAADYAGLSLSPHFKAPSAGPDAAGGERRTRKARPSAPEPLARPVVPLDEASASVHPFIQGLVGSLPTPGESFPAERQEAWFDTARGIFRLIYEIGPVTGANKLPPNGGVDAS